MIHFYISFLAIFIASAFCSPTGSPIGAKELEEFLDDDQVQFLFDFRKDISRETDGYIVTSILVPETIRAGGGDAFEKLIPTGDR